MDTLHLIVGVAVLATNLGAGLWGGVAWLRQAPSEGFWYLLRTAQVAVVAQVLLGAILLLIGRSSPDGLHYLYGTLALFAALTPWVYAPPVPARRLLWFVGASFVAAALGIRAYTTSG